MKNRFLTCSLCLLLAGACTQLDDVNTRLGSLESRVTALENQVKSLNQNVSATQALLQAGTIASATEKDGVWTLVLSDGKEVVLTQGSIGVGAVPVMTVDADGYWMVDYGSGASYVLQNGQKVKATGSDGITPQFGVNNAGNWTVSYDGGNTFTEVPGPDGNPVNALPSGAGEASDSFFYSVTLEDGVFTLVLKDMRVITIPVVSGFICAIEGADEPQFFAAGETKNYAVTITGAEQTLLYAPAGWAVSLDASTLSVTAPLSTKALLADTDTDVSILALSASGAAAVAKMQVALGDVPPVPEVITDYYDAYESGKDLVIAGVTYNKNTHGASVLLHAEAAATDLKASIHQQAGIFFLEADETAWFEIPSVTEITGDVVLVSRYVDKPVTIRPSMCTKLRSGSLVMKNVILDMLNINGGTNATYGFNNANATADFSRWHLDGCRILNIQKPLLYANVAVFGFVSIVVKDCVFQLVYTTGNVQLFNFYGSTVLHTYKQLVFSNNVVFNASALAVQVFQYNQNITQSGSPWECTLEANNNIFYNCPSANGYFKFYQLASLKMNGNIFWADPSASLASYGFILYSPSQDASVVDASGNIAYGLAEGKNWLLAHGNSTVVPEGNTLPKLEESPFESFDTATGAYTLKAAYAAYGPQN